MGSNMVSYAFAIGEKNTYFIYNRYKFIQKDKIEEGTLINRCDDSLDPFVYRLEKCGVGFFKKLERSLIHTFCPGVGKVKEKEVEISDVEDEVEEDGDLIETQYLNGKNEVVKIFNQKCVIYYEGKSVYAFRQCGHQCIREQCFQNEGDVDILIYVVCRT